MAKVWFPEQKLFGDNCQIVMSGIGQFTWWIWQKIHFQVYYFSCRLCWTRGVQYGSYVSLDEARPPQRYVFKYIKIKMAESYFSGIWFGDKTICTGNQTPMRKFLANGQWFLKPCPKNIFKNGTLIKCLWFST